VRVQERAEQILADVPAWLWDGARLPVPVEQIADMLISTSTQARRTAGFGLRQV
jgi:hypothetical protein